MIWIILIAVIFLLAVVIFLVIGGLVLFLKSLKRVESKEAKNVIRRSIGTIIGGITGIVVGMLLVEFAGYPYPLPFILWMLGMTAGQLGGFIYSKYK